MSFSHAKELQKDLDTAHFEVTLTRQEVATLRVPGQHLWVG